MNVYYPKIIHITTVKDRNGIDMYDFVCSELCLDLIFARSIGNLFFSRYFAVYDMSVIVCLRQFVVERRWWSDALMEAFGGFVL